MTNILENTKKNKTVCNRKLLLLRYNYMKNERFIYGKQSKKN